MDDEVSAVSCATERHNKYMQIAKKQRYIEVFQCSADDMNLVLTGPSNANGANAAAMGQSAVLPPAATTNMTQQNGVSAAAMGMTMAHQPAMMGMQRLPLSPGIANSRQMQIIQNMRGIF